MRKRILYGGSFDPPTLAHQEVLEIAREAYPDAEILVIPAGSPPHKAGQRMRPADLRLKMAALAFGDIPGLRISDEECRRAGLSYTIDTLRAQTIGDTHSSPDPADLQLYLLMGSDSTLSLPKWRSPHEILKRAQILTVPRPGFDLGRIDQLAGFSPQEKAALKKGVLHREASALSSTEARALLEAGLPAEGVVPPKVLAFIQAKGLYKPQ